jgi:predicted RND superfamily exporter protein
MIETPEPEGLLEPARLQRIEALQRFLESLPHVNGTTSIADYLKQMNKAVNENRPEAYRLPEGSDLAAQLLLLYSASGDPTDLEEEIDYDYRLANVRAALDTGRFSELSKVVEQADRYVREEFNTADMTATLSGRVNVNYYWIGGIGESHFRGVAWALVAVWVMVSLSFRSAVLGLLAAIPVCMAVLLIYAVMGYTGIWLGVATSMFAAIAIGTGVDFAVHLLDRLLVAVREEGQTIDEALATLFPSTGRALLFNSSAVIAGFGVLTLSDVPPLVWFGTLVSVAAVVSFLASLTLLPAIVQVFRPRAIGGARAGVKSI